MSQTSWLSSLRTLPREVISLYAVHAARYLFVFIAIPFLARAFGVEILGIWLFFQAYGLFVTQLIEFGFALSATKSVVERVADNKSPTDIIPETLSAQFLLLVVVTIVSVLLWFLIPEFSEYSYVLILTVLTAAFQGMNLSWFFRGIGKSFQLAKIELSSKLITLVILILCVNSPEDITIAALAFFIGAFSAFSYSLLLSGYAFNRVGESIRSSRKTLTRSINTFMIRAGGSLISDGNLFLCGLIMQPREFGLFASAYKIATAIRGLITPTVDAMFPLINKLILQASASALTIAFKLFPILLALGLGLTLIMYFGADIIVSLMLGESFKESAIILKYFSILPLIICILHAFGTQWMVPIGKETLYSIFIIVSGSIGLMINFLSTPIYGSLAASSSILLSYGLIMIMVFVYLAQNRKQHSTY